MRLRGVVLLGCTVTLMSSFAHADLSDGALTSGSVHLYSGGQITPGGYSLLGANATTTDRYFDVTVDYAVFAPGTFKGDFTAFQGFGGLSSTDYVYAYQIRSSGTSDLSKMGIDLAGGTITSMGYDGSGLASGWVAPSSGRVGSDSFAFAFSADRLKPGQSSALLLVGSSDPWASAPMSILNGQTYASGVVSAPMAMVMAVPAPSAALLVLIGVGLISGARSRLVNRSLKAG